MCAEYNDRAGMPFSALATGNEAKRTAPAAGRSARCAVFMLLAAISAAAASAFDFGGAATGSACKDSSCTLPSDASVAEFSVVSPVPESAVKPLPVAPRLKTLDGKTIAIVGGSFMANVTHPEMKKLILAEYPTAKVYLLNEIGSAGPYPRPGVVRREKDAFQRRLRECKVDAVISGNGGCGLCTPKEAGSCIAAEELGIPSVMIAGTGFVREAKTTAKAAGLPALATAEYPGAFASHTREELLANTRNILWPQIKKGLTTPPPPDATAGDGNAAKTEISGSLAEIQRIFADSGWSDGLPVIPPTEEAVAEFLRFTDLPPGHSLGAIPPAQREVTVRHVAANGVMAGCPPEFMPLCLAFVEAMKAGDWRRPLCSTHAWTPYCWLNGPVARQLGFDCGQGEISEPKNAVFGRFMNLAMLNLGGYRVKENRMGTFGYLMPWCLVEDEEAVKRIGWQPYHVQLGFSEGDSTLTVASSINWGNNLVPATSDAERIKDMIAWDAVEKSQMAVQSGMPCTYRTFLLTEGVATALARRYRSKNALCTALEETARIPLASRAFANYWGNPGSAFDPRKHTLEQHIQRISRSEGAELTPMPPWMAWIPGNSTMTVPAMAKGKSAIIVTGDAARNKAMCVPGGGFKTVKIALPKDWDRLVAR